MGATLLAIDLGTTAVKTALYSTQGSLLAEGTREYPLDTPRPNWVEVHTETYWESIKACLADLWRTVGHQRGTVISLAISAQGETLVPVDENGDALRPAIVWLDNRAEAESEWLSHAIPATELYRRTGQPEMLPTWPAAKVLWIRRHEPDLAARTSRFLLIEDYLLARLTGAYVTEGSLATSTCYWDVESRDWWPEMLDVLEISVDQLPEVIEPGTAIGRILPSVADELGLPHDTVICAGALDQACGAIGGGNIEIGGFSENTGAAVAICSTLASPRWDPAAAIPLHYHGLAGRYMLHTFSGGGIVLKWFRDVLCEPVSAEATGSGRSAYDLLGELAAGVRPGADGLVMLPHLQGAMAPENNPHVRGAFVGLTLQHTRAHLVRAVMESIAFVVRRNVEAFAVAGVRTPTIRALGGGSRSGVWKQIEADVCGVPVETVAQPDAAALGAAILAGLGVGVWSTVAEAVDATVRIDRTFEPDPAAVSVYEERYADYLMLSDSLENYFEPHPVGRR